MSEHRSDVRHGFASLLRGALPDATIFEGEKDDFNGVSPVIVISGGGTLPDMVGVRNVQCEHQIDLFVFVLYSDPASGWTEEDAEDQIDEINFRILQVIKENQVNPAWMSISYKAQSQTNPAVVGGVDYKKELTSLMFS